jgi:hypothetical protein
MLQVESHKFILCIAQSPDDLQQSLSSQYAIALRENRHDDSDSLSYGEGEIIEDVNQLPGPYWRGRIGSKVGLFV